MIGGLRFDLSLGVRAAAAATAAVVREDEDPALDGAEGSAEAAANRAC